MTSILAAGLAPVAALADVKLSATDGSLDLQGELVDYNEEFYTIRTPLGDLRVSTERVSCFGDECPTFEVAEADFTIAGSESMGRALMPILMEGYAGHLDAASNTVQTGRAGEALTELVADGGYGDDIGSFLVSSSSTGDGFDALLDGSAQLAMASRRILPNEARALKKQGAGNMISPKQEHVIAVDSIVLITHPTNPVGTLNMQQVRDIYTGKITNWSEVGGSNAPIKVIQHSENSGARLSFEQNVFGGSAATTGTAVEASDSQALAQMVTTDENAIGYVGFAFQRGSKPLSLINECGIETAPNAFSAKTEEYPLQRRMYLYHRADADAAVQDIVNFAKSEDADGVIRKSGFIDLGISSIAQELDSARAASLMATDLSGYEGQFATNMLRDMVGFERLSTTFRFRTGSSRLDERGYLDMLRLVKFLEEQPAGSEIALVGFTDDVGAFDANLGLSQGRAGEVANVLRAQAPELFERVTIKTMGYGEVSPAACNVSEAGRSINRRVEVWIGNTAAPSS